MLRGLLTLGDCGSGPGRAQLRHHRIRPGCGSARTGRIQAGFPFLQFYADGPSIPMFAGRPVNPSSTTGRTEWPLPVIPQGAGSFVPDTPGYASRALPGGSFPRSRRCPRPL
jgi:hypothetical protein